MTEQKKNQDFTSARLRREDLKRIQDIAGRYKVSIAGAVTMISKHFDQWGRLRALPAGQGHVLLVPKLETPELIDLLERAVRSLKVLEGLDDDEEDA